MTSDSSPPNKPTAPVRARRWSPPQRKPHRPYRTIVRLIGIPVVAVAGSHSSIAGCATASCCRSAIPITAKKSLAEVLKQLKFEPVRYAPIKTVSRTKIRLCAMRRLPLPDGGTVVIDYTFYWQGNNGRHAILGPPRSRQGRRNQPASLRAERSSPGQRRSFGLLRRYAPRNDEFVR